MNLFAERIAAGMWATIWVCECCMLVEANGECCADDSHGGDGCEPLNLIPDSADISLGMLTEEHDSECTEADRSEQRCNCEWKEFSRSQCAGCGSYLHGKRYALTMVYDMH